jgi:uncharacterized protein YjbI with pentapeptide repeats
MANQKQLAILKQGVIAWNQWRSEHADTRYYLTSPDRSGATLSHATLSGADLRGADLYDADLNYADLSGADLSGATLFKATLRGADLSGATLFKATLTQADLSYADLRGADLSGATLTQADLSYADLRGAKLEIEGLRGTTLRKADLSGHNLNNANLSGMDLSGINLNETSLIKTNFSSANLSNCSIYGIAAWDIKLDERTVQKNLIITPPSQPTITVDNLEVAQFIYLLLKNPKIRDVIDTIAKKAVLILGSFTPERKAILEAIREMLRQKGYLPILFDFDKPSSRDVTETVSILAHLARFIIADLTEPRSIPKELEAIVPTLAVPVQPLLEGSTRPYSMFKDYWKYQWVLEVYRYNGICDFPHKLERFVKHIVASRFEQERL